MVGAIALLLQPSSIPAQLVGKELPYNAYVSFRGKEIPQRSSWESGFQSQCLSFGLTWIGTKPGLWTLDWTIDWIMDSILDLSLDWTAEPAN